MGVKTDTLSNNGETAAVPLVSGKGMIMANGTWGGGTLTLQLSPNNGTTWIRALATVKDQDPARLTDNGAFAFEVPSTDGVQVRLSLTGATGPTITWWIITEG